MKPSTPVYSSSPSPAAPPRSTSSSSSPSVTILYSSFPASSGFLSYMSSMIINISRPSFPKKLPIFQSKSFMACNISPAALTTSMAHSHILTNFLAFLTAHFVKRTNIYLSQSLCEACEGHNERKRVYSLHKFPNNPNPCPITS